MGQYKNWIIDNGLSVASCASGRCREASERMQFVFPELIICKGLVCGFTKEGYEKKYPHWWLKTATQEIIDPTVAQFEFLENIIYKEATGEPTGRCTNCGDLCYEGRTCCSQFCDSNYKMWLEGGYRMKAKDYFQRFDAIAELSSETLKEILLITAKVIQDMAVEMKEIMEKRRAKTNAAIVSIYVEIEDKFRALTEMLHKKYKESFIDNCFFSKCFQTIFPELWDAIHKVKRHKI
jgi:hypothetical protein